MPLIESSPDKKFALGAESRLVLWRRLDSRDDHNDLAV